MSWRSCSSKAISPASSSAHGEYDPAKFADILAKTAKKMSPRGRAAALALIALPPSLAPVVQGAGWTPVLTASGSAAAAG